MNPHFFTAPFYFAFIWFKVQGSRFKVQGSGVKVQGSGVRGGGFAAFLDDDYPVSSAFSSRGRLRRSDASR